MTPSPKDTLDALRGAVTAAWRGEPATVDRLLVAVLCGGHVLIEDVPGVGKTTLASALGAAMGGSVRRVQGTADLLPADLTGGLVLDPRSRELTLREGPLFANVVLADEINRAPPRTQSALLEAMSEAAVTLDGVVRPLPAPFFVLATQNPFDQHGTWPLPESQLDRFLMRLRLGYPRRDDERQILRQGPAPRRVAAVTTPEALVVASRALDDVVVAPAIEDYLLDVVGSSRRDPRLLRGVSPRGAAAWHRAARAAAVVAGRAFVVPDDLRSLAPSVLAHRVVPRAPDGGAEAVAALLAEVPVPR